MNPLSVPVHLSVMTCPAQRQLLPEAAENRCPCVFHWSTFKFGALCSQVNGVWKVLMDFVTLNKQKSTIKSPDKKSGSPIFCRGFFWSLVRSDKILPRQNTSVALVYNTRWQFFLQSKQKFCLVRPAQNGKLVLLTCYHTCGKTRKAVETLACMLAHIPTAILILPNFHSCFY